MDLDPKSITNQVKTSKQSTIKNSNDKTLSTLKSFQVGRNFTVLKFKRVSLGYFHNLRKSYFYSLSVEKSVSITVSPELLLSASADLS
jgi:hypothetical protein